MTTQLERAPLTDRQAQVLAWISRYIDDHGYSPTIREMCVALGIRSPNGVVCHLEPLRRKGYIDWLDARPRTIRTTADAT